MGHKRSRQGEKAGCFTDVDGYKRQPDNTSTWQSGRGSGQLLPPRARWPTEAHWQEYPLQSRVAEFGLMAKAVADRWNVPEDIKRILVERMSEFLMAEPELAIDAARVLVQCEKQNLDAKKRKRAATARVQIQNILQSHVEGPAPDPEYIAWKQQRLLEQQNVVDSSLAQPLVAAVAEGQDQPEEPAAPLPGGEPRAPADRLGTAPIAPLAGALVRRKTRLLV